MGKQNFSIIGFGYTEQQALSNAINADRDVNGHQDGYNGGVGSAVEPIKSEMLCAPKPPQKASVTRLPQNGTRKWATKYVARYHGYSLNEQLLAPPSADTLGECIRLAREFSLKHNASLKIIVEKRLVAGSETCAEISPRAGVPGKWRFSGEARC